MQLKTLIDTTQKIHLTSEMFDEIDSELEEFNRRSEKSKDLKFIIDFDLSKISYAKNQMDIPVIKYKKKKSLKGSVVDLKKRKPKNNELF